MRKLLIASLLFLSACGVPNMPRAVVPANTVLSTGIRQIIDGDFGYGVFAFEDNGNTCYIIRTYESSGIDCVGENDAE